MIDEHFETPLDCLQIWFINKALYFMDYFI